MPSSPEEGPRKAGRVGTGVVPERPDRIIASITSEETPAARSFWMSYVVKV